ncbi:MAG: malto-oligosyltrehalose trehalohydrolase [Mycobacteriales bacterium]
MEFRVWAPAAGQVRLRVDGRTLPMAAAGGGWWAAAAPGAGPGSDYGFLLGGDPTPLPDPRSRWQPAGVHGLSRVPYPLTWSDTAWTGRPLAGSVLYELHVGTFTPEGTFDAAARRLDHLVDLGVDAVELLPVNAFNGPHGWGYDGVDWYAVHEPYGGPAGLARFVDASHRAGLAVYLDVVYNHLGPSGGYLPRFGPYFHDDRLTTWGPALNLDGPDSDPVRRHVIDNALMWLRDYHLDGLRIDAVHAFSDSRATPILAELAADVAALSAHLRRPLSLVAESDLNDAGLVTPPEAGGDGLHAVWNDDFHHALHALLTGERQGYYADFGSLDDFARTYRNVYFHDGRWSSFRRRHHGAPVDQHRTPGHRFVVSLQNHDQIGNRATGDRLAASLSPGLLQVGAALLLTAPYTPMLFMGEEWAASTPWQFFTSHPEPELAATVAAGRRAEFAHHGWTGDVPDPQDPATFRASVLNWTERDRPVHREVLDFHRALLALRRSRPELTDPRLDRVAVDADAGRRWLVVYRGPLRVAANLAPEPQVIPLGRASDYAVLLSSASDADVVGDTVLLPGESVAVLEESRQKGNG